jgi:hypothetical protein
LSALSLISGDLITQVAVDCPGVAASAMAHSTAAAQVAVLRPTGPEPKQALPFDPSVSDAQLFLECGGLMPRNGTCYKCENCGGTRGSFYQGLGALESALGGAKSRPERV